MDSCVNIVFASAGVNIDDGVVDSWARNETFCNVKSGSESPV